VGIDVPYCYPRGTIAQILQVGGEPEWLALWEGLHQRVQDDEWNDNNRFEVADGLNNFQPGRIGPYWGRPAKRAHLTALPMKKPACYGNQLREYRLIEEEMRQCKKRPFSVWQLYGNGSVGSQSLTAIPILQRLRSLPELQRITEVWPFETGWGCAKSPGPRIVHAEIWPGAIDCDLALHDTKDAAQVMSYIEWAAGHDVRGSLAQYFDPLATDPAKANRALIEGWILGFRC
jgi:hypothetical protein